MVTAIRERGLTVERLIELLATNAHRIFGLVPPPETETLIDPDASYVISDDALRCSPGWSPYSGMRVWGRVTRVRVRGRVVFDGEAVLAAPGDGRRLIP
jgi:dihydroorotase-like cyclic amidohydrolase